MDNEAQHSLTLSNSADPTENIKEELDRLVGFPGLSEKEEKMMREIAEDNRQRRLEEKQKLDQVCLPLGTSGQDIKAIMQAITRFTDRHDGIQMLHCSRLPLLDRSTLARYMLLAEVYAVVWPARNELLRIIEGTEDLRDDGLSPLLGPAGKDE